MDIIDTEVANPPGSAELWVSIVLYRPLPDKLVQTLATLGQALRMANFGYPGQSCVLLVDHSPTRLQQTEILELQNHLGPGIRLDYDAVGANPGFGQGHNRAFGKATGATYFLVANPDLEFTPESIRIGISFLHDHPEVGVIAPGLIEPECQIRPACFRSPDLRTLLLRGLGRTASDSARIARYECRDWDPSTPVFNPPLMSGCCLLFRSATYDRLEGFNPDYFLYFEDFDLARRAAGLGVSAYCPTMHIRHSGGGVSRKSWRHRWWFIRSAWRFYINQP